MITQPLSLSLPSTGPRVSYLSVHSPHPWLWVWPYPDWCVTTFLHFCPFACWDVCVCVCEREKERERTYHTSTATLSLHFLQLKMAWGELGGDIGGKGKKLINLTTNFGRLDHIRSDLFKVLSEKQHTLDLSHPVVTDTMQKGQALFVISSIYKAEKCEVSVSDPSLNDRTLNTVFFCFPF